LPLFCVFEKADDKYSLSVGHSKIFYSLFSERKFERSRSYLYSYMDISSLMKLERLNKQEGGVVRSCIHSIGGDRRGEEKEVVLWRLAGWAS
jgi:hypothetical protein